MVEPGIENRSLQSQFRSFTTAPSFLSLALDNCLLLNYAAKNKYKHLKRNGRRCGELFHKKCILWHMSPLTEFPYLTAASPIKLAKRSKAEIFQHVHLSFKKETNGLNQRPNKPCCKTPSSRALSDSDCSSHTRQGLA